MEKTARIPVHPKRYALVDIKDAEKVEEYRWYAKTNQNGRTYVQAFPWSPELKKSRVIQLSRLLTGAKPSQLVSFKNGDPLDCRRNNLQLVTRSYISRNRRKLTPSASRYKGVKKETSAWGKEWRADIHIGDRYITLGRYATEEAAARAYDVAARRYFGKAARLNLPHVVGTRNTTSYHTITCPVCKRNVRTNQPNQKYCERDGYCASKYRRAANRAVQSA